MIGFLNGMELVENNILTIEHKEIKRKHRQKRIQKKWIKKYGYNYSNIPSPQVLIFQNKIFGHPETLKAIINKVKGEECLNDSRQTKNRIYQKA